MCSNSFLKRKDQNKMLLKRGDQQLSAGGFGLIEAIIAALAAAIALAALAKASWISFRHFNHQQQILSRDSKERCKLLYDIPQKCSVRSTEDGLQIIQCESNSDGRRILQNFVLN